MTQTKYFKLDYDTVEVTEMTEREFHEFSCVYERERFIYDHDKQDHDEEYMTPVVFLYEQYDVQFVIHFDSDCDVYVVHTK
jgi:hypothetical protein